MADGVHCALAYSLPPAHSKFPATNTQLLLLWKAIYSRLPSLAHTEGTNPNGKAESLPGRLRKMLCALEVSSHWALFYSIAKSKMIVFTVEVIEKAGLTVCKRAAGTLPTNETDRYMLMYHQFRELHGRGIPEMSMGGNWSVSNSDKCARCWYHMECAKRRADYRAANSCSEKMMWHKVLPLCPTDVSLSKLVSFSGGWNWGWKRA